jgi:CHAT domain-containing protein/Tfp pilus assembly protein PilF
VLPFKTSTIIALVALPLLTSPGIAQIPQDQFQSELIESGLDQDTSKVRQLVAECRLWVKPVVNQLISDYIHRNMTGDRWAAKPSKEAASLIARTFEDSYGEKSLSLATRYLDSWTLEQMGKKAQADRIFGIAENYRSIDQNTETAVKEYQRALELYLDIGDRRGEGEVFGRLGLIYWAIDPDTCLAYYQNALKARETADDRYLVGATLNSLGVVYLSKMRNLDSTIYYLEQACIVRRQIGDLDGLGKSLVYLALSYQNTGQYLKAQDAYLEAYQVNEQVGNKVKMAEAMQNTASLLNSTGHYQEALDKLEIALRLRKELEDPLKTGNVLNEQGNVYASMRDYDKAIELYSESLDIMKTEENPEGLAIGYNNIGTILDEVKRFDRAIDYYTRSLEICRKSSNEKGVGTALGNLGNSYYGLGQFKQAESYQQQALAISRKLDLMENEIHNLINLSNAQNAMGKLDSAWYNCNLAVQKANEMNNPQLVWIATLNMGDNYEKRGEYRKAIEHYESALDIVEDIRLSLHRDEFRADYMAAERFAYEGLIHLLGKLHQIDPLKGHDQKAFLYAERSKSRAFLDRLSDTLQPATMSEVQLSIPKDQNLVLEFFLGDSSSCLWVISQEKHEMFVLPSRQELADDIETLRFSLSTPDNDNLSFFTRSAQHLYSLLIEPAEKHLKKNTYLVIIPDGGLFYLPFEVLLTKDPKKGEGSDPASFPYLVLKHPISYGHSSTILMHMPSSVQTDGRSRPGLLAFGDPAFLSKRPRLEYSAREVQNIASLFEPSEADVFTRNEASEQRIKSMSLDPYRYIHFATHGTVDEAIPDFSSLVLALDPDRKEDGLLQAWEIAELEMNADMVVLSACQTGLGKLVWGEGLVGLTQSLIYSGASSVIVSLWSVADHSTSNIMTSLYHNLIIDEMDKSVSLQKAKQSMLEDVNLAHPFYWAPFILIGNR